MEIPGYAIGERIGGSGSSSVLRAVRRADGTPVVIKTLTDVYPRRQHVGQLRREFRLLDRLAAVRGVIDVLGLESYGHGNVAVVMESFGRSLADRLTERGNQPLPLAPFFDVAIRLAEVLGELHHHGVVHKDVTPANVLVTDDFDGLRLIDFGIASEPTAARQSNATVDVLEGSLPYMSPEQTGRTNRSVDYRSDFYSLGVTLFELLTGDLPFHAADALEWVHGHISRRPPAPHEVRPEVPAVLSNAVVKLMAKNAEDRYQSARGLIADLEQCRSQWLQNGTVVTFPLARHDVTRQFLLPERLFGRDHEVSQLAGVFELVAAGSTELCLVTGDSGIGKTSLVNEFGNAVVRENGALIRGKFDQLASNQAYAAVGSAFGSLVSHMLAEPAAQLDAWRASFLDELGPNAGLIVDVVPELVALVGPQPAVAALPSAEAQNRLQIAFTRFVRLCSGPGRPLAIFLDDLQWSDAPTLALIRQLLASRELSHLLIIAAYRPREVDPRHPLRLALRDIEGMREVHEIALRPLGRDAVCSLVAETVWQPPAQVRPLADLLHNTTQGNPFFVNELLRSLHEAGLVTFDPAAGQWTWDLHEVERAGISGDVAEFMAQSLHRLPAATQRVMQLAACIGNVFDLRTLAATAEASMSDVADALLAAVQRGMLVPVDDAVDRWYAFHHDRVQQAAYDLIDDDRKQAVHLRIGRLLQLHADDARESRLIDIVDHLDRGRRLIDDAAERLALAELNLVAGKRAHASAAYEMALGYLAVGRDLLPAGAWDRHYELSMALAAEYQQCAYLLGRHDEANEQMDLILMRAQSDLERAEALAVRTRQYATLGRPGDSIRASIAGLALLGIRFPDHPTRADIDDELRLIEHHLAGRTIEELASAPPLTDRRQAVIITLLTEIFPAAFLSDTGDLFPLLVLKSVNVSLQHGNSPEAVFAYATYGMLLCGVLDDPALGYRYGRLAVTMNDRFDDVALRSRITYVFAMFIQHWTEHWSAMTPWFRRGIEAGYQSGDLLYLAYSAQDCIIWDPTLDLEAAAQQHQEYLAIVRDCRYRDSLDSGTLFLQMQRNFLGLTDDLCSLNDGTFDEAQCVAGMLERRFMTGVANYHIYKLEICVLYRRWAEARAHAEFMDDHVASVMSLPQLVRFRICAFLTITCPLATRPSAVPAGLAEQLQRHLTAMRRWAEHCPVNFGHLHTLMEAELRRLDGDVADAEVLYDRAIEQARSNGYRRDEAVALELAARCLIESGRLTAGEGYLRAAYHVFHSWGASRKVSELEREFPGFPFVASAVVGVSMAGVQPTVSQSFSVSALDVAAIIRASQAISGELIVDQLWSVTLPLLLQAAGGQWACVVLRHDTELVVKAEASVAGTESDRSGFSTPRRAEDVGLPLSVVNFVLRTGQPVVINDRARAHRFARDAYLRHAQPESLMCIPLSRHGHFEAVIYMENRAVRGVFTPDRIEVIRLLAAQAAISLENAELYQEQLSLTEAQRRFVPQPFLDNLSRHDIAHVGVGEHVAKDMSVLFADLRGFTPLAERLHPKKVFDVLNAYFASAEPAIVDAGGFIDSFSGDEILALFDSTVDAAVTAGIGMSAAIDQLNMRLVEAGDPEIRMGIGLNTGPLLLGTVGSSSRIQCSVFGDTVNAASRIEQLTKTYGARFLIGQATFDRLARPDAFSLRALDRVAVRGKTRSFDVYEVLDAESPARRAAKEATSLLLDEVVTAYRSRRYEAARASALDALRIDPDDPVLALYLNRCETLLRDPPSPEWNAVNVQ